MERKDAIRRIKALLAHEGGTDANEVATALELAHRMMKKYKVTLEDLAESEIQEAEAMASKSKILADWITGIAAIVKELLKVEYYWKTVDDQKTGRSIWKVVIVGRDPQQELGQYYFEVLLQKLRQARREHAPGRPTPEVLKRRDAYAYGWTNAVYQKVADLTKNVPDTPNNYTGILPIDALKEYVEKATGGNTFRPRQSDGQRDDARVGYEEGKEVDLNAGIRRTGQKLIG